MVTRAFSSVALHIPLPASSWIVSLTTGFRFISQIPRNVFVSSWRRSTSDTSRSSLARRHHELFGALHAKSCCGGPLRRSGGWRLAYSAQFQLAMVCLHCRRSKALWNTLWNTLSGRPMVSSPPTYYQLFVSSIRCHQQIC